MRAIQIKVMQFGELSEEAKKKARVVVKELYAVDAIEAAYIVARDDVRGYANDLGLTGIDLTPGRYCMNFDIDDRPYGDAAEGVDIEFPIDNYIRELFNDNLIPLSMAEFIGSCRKFALLSNDPHSSECEKDNARLGVIRELSRLYYKCLGEEIGQTETDDWACTLADVNGMVFDREGRDATHLLSEHIIDNVVKY